MSGVFADQPHLVTCESCREKFLLDPDDDFASPPYMCLTCAELTAQSEAMSRRAPRRRELDVVIRFDVAGLTDSEAAAFASYCAGGLTAITSQLKDGATVPFAAVTVTVDGRPVLSFTPERANSAAEHGT